MTKARTDPDLEIIEAVDRMFQQFEDAHFSRDVQRVKTALRQRTATATYHATHGRGAFFAGEMALLVRSAQELGYLRGFEDARQHFHGMFLAIADLDDPADR